MSNLKGSILDVGCAGGSIRTVPAGMRYVGLDYPATGWEMYRSKPDVFADAACLPFKDESFDTVILADVIEHVADATGALAEIVRVLKPGGVLLLSVPFLYPLHDAPHDYRRLTAPGVHHSLALAGFRPGPVESRNGGVAAAALLISIACAEAVLDAFRSRRWRLLFAPVLVACIPLFNVLGWMTVGLFGPGKLLASGYFVKAHKPD